MSDPMLPRLSEASSVGDASVFLGGAADDGGLPDLRVCWTQVQARLREQVGDRLFATWLSDLQPVGWRGGVLEIAVSTLFIKDFVGREYVPLVQDAVSTVVARPVTVVLTVAPVFQKTPTVPAAVVPAAADTSVDEVKPWLDASALDGRYTFDTYVMGPSNQFAFAAAKRVAEDQEVVFNPFFLYGGVGLGKTHLMQAIGWELKRRKPDIRIMYLSAEQFFMRFIRALREKDTYDFKEVCRGADVLMVDDIQFIAGKDATQEEFFHTFNELVAQGKKVILTADKSPHELAHIEERLKSRLGSGLTVEIHVPEVETRLAILQKKAEERELELAPDVLQFLAQNIQSNVRELEGALNRLLAFSKLTGSDITVAFARDQLRDLLRVQIRHVSLDDIQQVVAEFCNIRLADLVGPRRTKELAEARQTAMWLAKQMTTKSYPDIGRAFGGRDHTTVMHAVDKIEKARKDDMALAENLRVLERKLSGR